MEGSPGSTSVDGDSSEAEDGESSRPDGESVEDWPTDEWIVTTPEEQGMDSSQLAELVERARAENLGFHSLLIVRHGRIVVDATYFPYDGTRPHDVASVTKSLASSGVGLALARGELSTVSEPLLSLFPQYSPSNVDARKEAMTLEHALTMTSGFDCVNDPTEITLLDMQDSTDFVDFALSVPMAAEPGDTWNYCSTASHLLSGVVQGATGKTLADYLDEGLFEPIGIHDYFWPLDPQGFSHGWGDARFFARDLARIGLLHLRRGRWDDQQLLTEEWVERATTARALNDAPTGGYGYQWWTDDDTGSYRASGRGGQFISVIPALDLVIVTAAAAGGDQLNKFDELVTDVLLPAVRSDQELDPNPQGLEALEAAVAEVARPPAREAVPPPAAIAATVSGRRYTIDENTLGWEAFAIDFGDSSATLTLAIDGADYVTDVGLDGVPRITRGSQLTRRERHDDVDLALAGGWTDDTTFEVSFDSIDRIDAGTFTFVFEGDLASVAVLERTFVMTPIPLTAVAD